MFENFWHRKEKPFLSLQGFGGGAGGNSQSSGTIPMDASGGTTSTFTDPGGTWKCHVFLVSGTFVVNALGTTKQPPGAVDTIQYLCVGGGGGGGCEGAGGGGAGGLVVSPDFPDDTVPTSSNREPRSNVVTAKTYPISIGGGGEGGLGPPNADKIGHAGQMSYIGPGAGSENIAESQGGGYGNSIEPTNSYPRPGGPGGSGGGGCYRGNPYGGSPGGEGHGTGTDKQGNDGGAGIAADFAGGGGGAGAVGADGSPTTAGPGGDGLQVLILGPPTSPSPIGAPGPSPLGGYFAGGGGGGGDVRGNGGAGGGGRGGQVNPHPSPDTAGVSGTANTGGGGGGTRRPGITGGDGGSGIVVIRYRI